MRQQKESAEEKVNRIIKESYFGNNIENLARVRMLKCSAVKDKKNDNCYLWNSNLYWFSNCSN